MELSAYAENQDVIFFNFNEAADAFAFTENRDDFLSEKTQYSLHDKAKVVSHHWVAQA